ncbi:MAG: hypothetical protein IJT94_16180 [Oscillibacter sp.]|nr:hypothetical protein [Oscillibacter sp.]
MASWNVTATDEEPSPTLLDRFWGRISGFWGLIVRVLILLFLAWLFFTGMALLSTEVAEEEKTTYQAVEEEDNDAVIQQADKRLWSYLMNFANSLNYMEKGKAYELGSEKSREFGEAYFQPSDTIFVKEVKFYDDPSNQRTVEIVYEMGVNKKIHLTFQNNHIWKEMTRYEGFSEAGSFLRYLQWYSYGRFMKGYPRYTCEVAMENGLELGTRTIKKEVIRMKPFNKVVRAVQILRRGI